MRKLTGQDWKGWVGKSARGIIVWGEDSAALQGQDAKDINACCTSPWALIPALLQSPVPGHRHRCPRLSLSAAGFGVRKEFHERDSLALGVWMDVFSCSFWQGHSRSLVGIRADVELKMEKPIGPLSPQVNRIHLRSSMKIDL